MKMFVRKSFNQRSFGIIFAGLIVCSYIGIDNAYACSATDARRSFNAAVTGRNLSETTRRTEEGAGAVDRALDSVGHIFDRDARRKRREELDARVEASKRASEAAALELEIKKAEAQAALDEIKHKQRLRELQRQRELEDALNPSPGETIPEAGGDRNPPKVGHQQPEDRTVERDAEQRAPGGGSNSIHQTQSNGRKQGNFEDRIGRIILDRIYAHVVEEQCQKLGTTTGTALYEGSCVFITKLGTGHYAKMIIDTNDTAEKFVVSIENYYLALIKLTIEVLYPYDTGLLDFIDAIFSFDPDLFTDTMILDPEDEGDMELLVLLLMQFSDN
jgi:hypothetical protein